LAGFYAALRHHNGDAPLADFVTALNRDDRRSAWLKAIIERRGFNKALVALANKTARIAWAMLTRRESYAAG
jgi:transposase